MKKILLACNWKLNGNIKLINKIYKNIKNININKNINLIIFPPIIYIYYFIKKLLKKKDKNICIGSQNIDINLSGSYTGDISAYMLKDIKCNYSIIGHSDRIIFHNENIYNISKKLNILINNNIIPILCIGDNKKEFDNNNSINYCINKIEYILKNNIEIIYKKNIKLYIVYEPIWAIGNYNKPKIEYIEKIINNIHYFINKKFFNINKKIKLMYGGSISEYNIYNIININNINGVLIGKNSIKIKNFINILNICNKIYF